MVEGGGGKGVAVTDREVDGTGEDGTQGAKAV